MLGRLEKYLLAVGISLVPYAPSHVEKPKTTTVSRHEMPSNVEAFYDPISDTKTKPNDRPPTPYDAFVDAHEDWHRYIKDEYQTDCMAAAETGHYEFIRSPVKEKRVL